MRQALLLSLLVGAVPLALALRKRRRSRGGVLANRGGVLVKLGGSAITSKAEFETLNHAALTSAVTAIACSGKRTVVLHGAGSFGHFQAREHGISKGTADARFSWLGFGLVRESVTKLNRHVVGALLREGVAAVGVSPFPRWATSAKVPSDRGASQGTREVCELLEAGLTPVLHGDAVLDDHQGCAILSGDTLMVRLAEALAPELAVFLTDVAGVYSHPPSDPGATLLRVIRVSPSGVIVETSTCPCTCPPDEASTGPCPCACTSDEASTRPLQAAGGPAARAAAGTGGAGAAGAAAPTTTTAAHDVTGGLATKLEAAATIAAAGVRVVIVQVGTPHAEAALRGEVPQVCTLIERA